MQPSRGGVEETCSILRYGSFASSNLEGAAFKDRKKKEGSAKLDHVKFSRASIPSADLSEMNLTGSSFAGAKLQKANFKNTILLGASFAGASVEESVFDSSNIVLANMSSGVFDLSSFKGSEFVLSNAEGASFLGATLSEANFYGTFLARSFLWGAKAPSIEAFAFGDFTDAKLDLSDITTESMLKWLTSPNDLENKKVKIFKARQLENWKSSNDYAVPIAAKKSLSDKKYNFFQSAIPFARSVSCERGLEFMEELVLDFEEGSTGTYFSDYMVSMVSRFPTFYAIAKKTQGFDEAVERLTAVGGNSANEYRSDTNEYGSTDIYSDWDWALQLSPGDPKLFLQSLKVGKCPAAEREPEKWRALIGRLEIASQQYAKIPKRRELTSSPAP